MFIDSHCHLHSSRLYPNSQDEVCARARQAGVRMIVVGTSESDSRTAIEFACTHEGVWATVGVHPHDTKNGWQNVKLLLDEKPSKLVAIGEIGLDYFYNYSARDIQIRALEEQLQWACDYSLPVSFHVREAYADFWPVFDGFKGIRGVLHSYSDSRKNLEEGLKRGLFIGINGISTFTKDKIQQSMFLAVPLERMLLETDAPYLTPVPFRGKVNEPTYVQEVAKYQAEARDIPLDTLAAVTTTNANTLFAI